MHMLGLTRPELRLALLAVAVRLALLLGATGGDLLLPDYDTSKTLPAELLQPVQPAAFHQSHSADGLQEPWMGDGQPQAGAAAAGATQSARPWLLRGWLVWDAVFFVDIAARGYVYEQYYAFFPLMPGEGQGGRNTVAFVGMGVSGGGALHFGAQGGSTARVPQTPVVCPAHMCLHM